MDVVDDIYLFLVYKICMGSNLQSLAANAAIICLLSSQPTFSTRLGHDKNGL